MTVKFKSPPLFTISVTHQLIFLFYGMKVPDVISVFVLPCRVVGCVPACCESMTQLVFLVDILKPGHMTVL